MRKVLFTLLALVVAMSVLADDYTAKWKKVNEAERKICLKPKLVY